MPSDDEAKTGPGGDLPEEVRHHYIKSNFHRVIHVEGAHGGISPRGQITMSVFNERFPIPQQSTTKIKNGKLGDEVREKRVARDGAVREVEATLVMEYHVAKSLYNWLQDKLKALESIQEADDRGSA